MMHDSPKRAVRCVRLATEDAPALSSLESRCFALPWTEQAFAEAFAGKTFHAFGIRETASPLSPRQLAGYIAVYHTPDEVEILNIVVFPLMYNGSTYLPIRAIGTLLDQEVVWDSKTQTVSLSDKTDTAPEDLTYNALNKRINKLETGYISLSDDVKATAKAGSYAENLTIYHTFHSRHLELNDTLKALQVDVSEAYRTGSIAKTNRDAFLSNLDSLDSKLAALHTSVLEKYGIDGDAATYKALRAEALDLQDDQKELEDLVSAAVKAKTVSDWKSADASARKEWKSFRNDRELTSSCPIPSATRRGVPNPAC